MTDQDQKQAQAMLNAAIAQRNQAMDQAIQLAAALQMANDKIAELEKPIARYRSEYEVAKAVEGYKTELEKNKDVPAD